MKLIIAIVQDEYSLKVIKSLTDNKYRTTRLSSTGGFLKSGNTTLLIGVEDEEVDDIINLIEEACNSKNKSKRKDGISIGKANIFVLNMEGNQKI